MARIVGPSGVEVDVADAVASGLVSGGYAEYVGESHVAAPPAQPVEPVAVEPQSSSTPSTPEQPVDESEPAARNMWGVKSTKKSK